MREKLMNASSVRVGAVSYLNTRPLVWRFNELAPQGELILDYPSRLADALADGTLDVALIPSVEFFHNPSYTIVSDACIACRGPVMSVKLFSRVPLDSIRSLALDEGSRTSVALVQILLQERFGLRPQLQPLPLGSSPQESTADAVLLIGDRAIHAPGGPFAAVWDLGEEWTRWSGLPFVFAMWVARAGVDLQGIDQALRECRDAGLEHLEEIAAAEAAPLGLTQRECIAYLRDNLYFYLGPREQKGLEMFYRRASQMGLAPEGLELGFSVCKAVG
jgi:chorismate dehydratase